MCKPKLALIQNVSVSSLYIIFYLQLRKISYFCSNQSKNYVYHQIFVFFSPRLWKQHYRQGSPQIQLEICNFGHQFSFFICWYVILPRGGVTNLLEHALSLIFWYWICKVYKEAQNQKITNNILFLCRLPT